MAKKHNKRKKLSRRARREHSGTPSTRAPVEPVPVTAAAPPRDEATQPTASPESDKPLVEKPAPAAQTSSAPAATKSAVGFESTVQHGPGGITAELAASEFPAVRRDLRKLAVSVVVLAAAVAGLTVLNDSTTVISNLGHDLFKLWK